MKDSARQLPKWRFVHRNEVETPFMTLRLGAAVLLEYNWYIQDDNSREQLGIAQEPNPSDQPNDPPDRPSLPAPDGPAYTVTSAQQQQDELPQIEDAYKWRDARFMLGGRIKTKRPITWSTGLMWDAISREFLVRQTGLVVAVPEWHGHMWIGRSKEGPSLNRVMVGYDGWTMERFTFSDAAIPLLADGIKWLGYLPQKNLIWNLGFFADALSRGQTFSYFERQVAGRVAYLKLDADSATLLHVGIGFHVGKPTDDTLQLKSKPEATTAPNYVNTGKFPATMAQMGGIEAYYRSGRWLFGTEYYLERAESDAADNPVFHGGDVVVTWLPTGETRAYTTVGGYFRAVDPREPVFEGGWGALELVLRASYIDLNSGTLSGGRFWRISPTINWHLNRNLRLELGYGYGVLDRFGIKGGTHFFQTRLQSQL